jgi:ketosteroid isomerase-like protein
MSKENVEIIRQGYELFNRTGEIDPAMYHPDFEYQEFFESPQPQRRGIEGFQQWARDIADAFEGFVLEPKELMDLGDRVLARVVLRGRGRGSGAPIETPMAVLWTLREGKIAACAVFRDEVQALEAAGLRE